MTEDQERQTAREVERHHPRWIVMWGCYSRLFWAFPRFEVPRGTIVSAPDPERLVVDMHRVEAEARVSAQVPVYQAPMPAAQLPMPEPAMRPTAAQVQRGALPTPAPQTGALGWVAQSARTRYDPYVSDLDQPDSYYGFDADDADPYDSRTSWQS